MFLRKLYICSVWDNNVKLPANSSGKIFASVNHLVGFQKKKKMVRGGENIQLCGEKKNALLILGVRGQKCPCTHWLQPRSAE